MSQSNIPPPWKKREIPTRATKIAPGLYSVPDAGGTLYIDAKELLEAEGIEPTLENQARIERAARELAAEQGGKPIDTAWFR